MSVIKPGYSLELVDKNKSFFIPTLEALERDKRSLDGVKRNPGWQTWVSVDN